VALLGPQLGATQVLAAVLTYRALFYIGPLLLANPVYLLFEAHARRN
jgi:glycosyltransferase 2 family protein